MLTLNKLFGRFETKRNLQVVNITVVESKGGKKKVAFSSLHAEILNSTEEKSFLRQRFF